MGKRYVNITKDEMEAFLLERGFQQMEIAGTRELVFGRVFTQDGHKVSLRILTAINPSGESRDCGSDAIRVQAFWMHDGEPVPVGRFQRCLRTKGWRQNIFDAIERAFDQKHWKICPKCGNPMVWRDKGEFFGCVNFFKHKCDGKPLKPGEQPPAWSYALKPDTYKTTTPQFNEAGELQAAPVKPVARKRSTRPINTPLNIKTSSLLANPVATPVKLTGAARYQIPADLITAEQLAVRAAFLEGTQNLLIGARAGCGKSAMLKDLSSFRQEGQRFVYLVFAKRNAAQAWKEFPKGVPSSTSHAFCIRWLRNEMKLPEKADEEKTYTIMEEVYPHLNNKDRKRIRKAVFRLVGLAKNWGCRPTDFDAIRNVMNQYTFELEEDHEYETVVDITSEVLDASLPHNCGLVYNFDDMLWWPVVLDMEPPKYDVVMVDEVQDFNACQLELIRRMEARGARIIAVGDPFQAVFRFRGADNESFNKVLAVLKATDRGCQELLLPDNFRCCIEIIDWVVRNTIVKDIRACKTAGHGRVIEDLDYTGILDLIVSEFGKTSTKVGMKTAVLGRTNSPLLTCAFDLIKLGRGVKVRILGRDIAKMLIDLVGEVLGSRRNCNLDEFLILLDDWITAIHRKYGDKDKYEALVAECDDNYACLKSIAMQCNDAKGVIATINEYFCDEDDIDKHADAVLFASGHRSKGLEWDRVIILRPDLCPHPAAETEEDLAQEAHLWYVMGTRGKKELVVCHDKRPD